MIGKLTFIPLMEKSNNQGYAITVGGKEVLPMVLSEEPPHIFDWVANLQTGEFFFVNNIGLLSTLGEWDRRVLVSSDKFRKKDVKLIEEEVYLPGDTFEVKCDESSIPVETKRGNYKIKKINPLI